MVKPFRKLQQDAAYWADYVATAQRLIADLKVVTASCAISAFGMKYANETLNVESEGAFFPAAAWLRAFFHDAGSFVAQPKKGQQKGGGPNGSLAAGCTSNTCGQTAAGFPAAVPAAPTDTCPDGYPSRSGFTDGGNFCCPAGFCVSHGQSANGTPNQGKLVALCLPGNRDTNELCRPENDSLLPTIQFFRNRQNNPAFKLSDGSKLSIADIIVLGAATAVHSCSRGEVTIDVSVGRIEATTADEKPLPSPAGVIADPHNTIFQSMGLNKNDMVTTVVGSHTIGGYRGFNNPDLTSCPFVPFDCTPSGQFASAPFDNNVFKVACSGVKGMPLASDSCAFNAACSTTASAEPNCPISLNVKTDYAACAAPGSTSLPSPGLNSDIYLCKDNQATQQIMLNYAQDQSFFFAKYKAAFVKMANLGWKPNQLVPCPWS